MLDDHGNEAILHQKLVVILEASNNLRTGEWSKGSVDVVRGAFLRCSATSLLVIYS